MHVFHLLSLVLVKIKFLTLSVKWSPGGASWQTRSAIIVEISLYSYTDITKCNTVIFKQLQTCSCQLQNCSGARTASFPHVHQNSCSCSETFFFQSAHLVGFQVSTDKERNQSRLRDRNKQHKLCRHDGVTLGGLRKDTSSINEKRKKEKGSR